MPLFKRRKKGKALKHWYYLFYVNGKRYTGSTGTTNRKEAERVESRKRVAAEQGDPLQLPRPKIMRDFINAFANWAKATNKKKKTISDYLNGCRLILSTPLAGMRMDHVTEDDIAATKFHDSPYSTNCALRTLRRAFHIALRKKELRAIPAIKLVDAPPRDRMVTQEDESRLLKAIEHAATLRRYKKRPPSPLPDVLKIMLDSGMRDGEVTRMRIEYISWEMGRYFNPQGKTKRARRMVPLSERVLALLRDRCADRREGWVFPSRFAPSGHIELRGLQKHFRQIARQLGMPEQLKLYCARHTFGTVTMDEIRNPALVQAVMGHESIATTMRYLHPDVDRIRSLINRRNESKMVQ